MGFSSKYWIVKVVAFINDERKYFFWIGFIATVYGANWSLVEFGIVSIGFGLTAPAGVYFAGLAFSLRDMLHENGGRWWILSAILAGAVLSAMLSDAAQIAVASGTAFMLSEISDWLVYTPLRRKGWTIAVMCSNFVGLIIDSAVFLWLAFGSIQFIEGQIIGKLYMTGLAVGLILLVRKFSRIRERI